MHNLNLLNYNRLELILYYENLPNLIENQWKDYTEQAALLADLLSLQRLYNTYKLLQIKQGKTVRNLYTSLLEIIWNKIAGQAIDKEILYQYQSLEDIAELLACGVLEDFQADYIRPFCERFFPEFLRNTEEDMSIIEINFITYISYLIKDLLKDFRTGRALPTIYYEMLGLARSITNDNCCKSKQDIFLQSYFLKEIEDSYEDCFNAYYFKEWIGTQNILNLQTNYVSKFFMSQLYCISCE